MDSDSDIDVKPNITDLEEEVKLTTLDSLPETSRKAYQRAYNLFLKWKGDDNAESFSENVLLDYFTNLSKKFKSSTLWTQYSMLKTSLSFYHDVDIAKYLRLKAFLKRQAGGFKPKKSKVFTSTDIDKFITEAPDKVYLVAKVALIMGVIGACRRHELYQMRIHDFTDMGTSVLVTIPDSKSKILRNFIVTGRYYEIYKKYLNLRPPNVNDPWFFINYHNGKCTVQRMGLNKLGAMGKDIAKYLKLPNPEMYTGHCFRRSSCTIIVDGDGDITTLKPLNSWQSTAIAGSVDESMKDKLEIFKKIENAAEEIANSVPSATGMNFDLPSTSKTANCQFESNVNIQQSKSSPKMIFNDCTFNFSS